MYKYVLLILISFSLASCRSKDGDINIFSTDDDIALGLQFHEQFDSNDKSFVLSRQDYPEVYRRLQKIKNSILKSEKILHRDEFPWELYVIRNDSVLNAFCTPGGYIYVYTGLIKFLDSEDQLAGVIGHEIAHADLRHGTEQITKSYGIKLLIRAVMGNDSFLGDIAGNLLGMTFSRSDETEADMQSVAYLMDTDYDPRGVAEFFLKMQSGESTSSLMQFISTHPNPENRIGNIYKQWELLGSKKGERFVKEYNALKKLLP